MSARAARRELVDAGDRRAEAIAVLKHHLARLVAGDPVEGLLLVIERAEGGYVTAQTGTSNVAARLGRLELLKQDVLDLAVEDDAGDNRGR